MRLLARLFALAKCPRKTLSESRFFTWVSLRLALNRSASKGASLGTALGMEKRETPSVSSAREGEVVERIIWDKCPAKTLENTKMGRRGRRKFRAVARSFDGQAEEAQDTVPKNEFNSSAVKSKRERERERERERDFETLPLVQRPTLSTFRIHQETKISSMLNAFSILHSTAVLLYAKKRQHIHAYSYLVYIANDVRETLYTPIPYGKCSNDRNDYCRTSTDTGTSAKKLGKK